MNLDSRLAEIEVCAQFHRWGGAFDHAGSQKKMLPGGR